jgi:hypothetical protein
MRSFFIALIFLLMVSYWAHLFVTREFDSNNLATIIIENKLPDNGICECRCCLLSGTMCESVIRHSISFKKDFSCHLCTDHFCTMNTTEIQQCQWMYAMKAACFQYQPRRQSFVSVRPILQ